MRSLALALLIIPLALASLYTVDSGMTYARESFTTSYLVNYVKTNVLTVGGKATYMGRWAIFTVTVKPLGCVALIQSTAISIPPYSGGDYYYVSIPDVATYVACSGIMIRTVTAISASFSATFTVTQNGITTYTETLSANVPVYYVYTETITWTQVMGAQVIAGGTWNCSSVIQTLSFNIPTYTVRTSPYNGTSSELITQVPVCPGSAPLITPTAYLPTTIELTPQLVLSPLFEEVNLQSTTSSSVPAPLLLVLVGLLAYKSKGLNLIRRRSA